jgi:diacylglycerol kinase family enzyme
MLPEIVGPEAAALDLRFVLPSGEEATTALLVLVSNNPYVLTHIRGSGTRERIDGGVLGVVSVMVRGALDAERLAALDAVGQVQRYPGWHEWTPTEFEVRSDGPVEIGVDGEALALEPPLRFVIRPRALTVRLPRQAIGLSPAEGTVRPTARPTLDRLAPRAAGRTA